MLDLSLTILALLNIFEQFLEILTGIRKYIQLNMIEAISEKKYFRVLLSVLVILSLLAIMIILVKYIYFY